MAEKKRPRWRTFAYALGALVLLGLLVTAFLFPHLLKRYIEQNSEAWIDRKITIGSIVLNPITGTYAVHDLVCFEPRSEQVFISFNKLGVKGDVLDGFRKGHWRFHDAELRDPYVHIHHRGERFNFSDLLELGGEADTAKADQGSVLFTVVDIALTGGRMDYDSDLLREPLHVVDLAVACNLITSESGHMDFVVGLGLTDGTRLDGGFTIDTDSARYAVEAHLRDLDLASSLPYLQDFFGAGSLAGKLDVDLDVKQSYADSSDLALSARMHMRGLDLRGPDGDPLVRMRSLRAHLDTLVGDHLELGVVDIDGLDARFALLPDGSDNWTRLLRLVPDTTADEAGAMVLDASASNYFVLLAEYISYLGSAVTTSDYSADSLVFRNGALFFEDLTVPGGFNYRLSAIDLRAQRFNAGSQSAPVSLAMRLNNAGSLVAKAIFDPADLRNVTLSVRLDSLLMPHLDAYTRWYAAHPALDGVLAFTSETAIHAGMIDSRNNLRIDHLRFGKRIQEHDPEVFVLPLRLAAGLLKDVKGMVSLDIPVRGDLRDPSFKVLPIVWQVLKNLVVKAAAAPAKLLVRVFDGADERALEKVRFEPMQQHLEKEQERALQQVAKALLAKPDLRVDLVELVDSVAETGALALFQAKARYLLPGAVVLSAADSTRVLAVSERDTLFMQWMDVQMPGTASQSMHQRSVALVGASSVRQLWSGVEQARRAAVRAAFVSAGVVPTRYAIRKGTPAELAVHGGPPGYLFVYDIAE
ncbi:MAG: DUF748 domain-containing protein [Flavobacteriales bacterium]|nr:DUF748 domain-containing protein [Flavobacteriales bacterium]